MGFCCHLVADLAHQHIGDLETDGRCSSHPEPRGAVTASLSGRGWAELWELNCCCFRTVSANEPPPSHCLPAVRTEAAHQTKPKSRGLSPGHAPSWGQPISPRVTPGVASATQCHQQPHGASATHSHAVPLPPAAMRCHCSTQCWTLRESPRREHFSDRPGFPTPPKGRAARLKPDPVVSAFLVI